MADCLGQGRTPHEDRSVEGYSRLRAHRECSRPVPYPTPPFLREPVSAWIDGRENRRFPADLLGGLGAPRPQRTPEFLSECRFLSVTWGYGGFGPKLERIEIAKFNGAKSHHELEVLMVGGGNWERNSCVRASKPLSFEEAGASRCHSLYQQCAIEVQIPSLAVGLSDQQTSVTCSPM